MPPLSPRVAVRAAEHELPAGLVAELDANLRAQGFSDRLDEVLKELTEITARVRLAAACVADRPGARLAGAHPRPLGAALADRGRRDPRPDRRPLRHDAGTRSTRSCRRALELLGRRRRTTTASRRRWTSCARTRRGSRRARRSCCCSRSSARRRSRCSARSASRGRRDDSRGGRARRLGEAERLRELIRVVQESGIGEVTIEEGEMRVTVRAATEGDPRRRPRSAAPMREPSPPRGRRRAAAERGHPRRVADGRHLLPRALAGRGAVRRGGRHRRPSARRSASSRR